MILGPSCHEHLASLSRVGRATLDDMFRRAVRRRPDATALVDPPNRDAFTDGPPRRLTYAQADRVVAAIAGRLRRMGLQMDQIVGMQMPNTVEAVLTFLGILRAGLIAAPLPLLWRRAEAVAALSRLGAKALITLARVGAVDHCTLAMTIAAETFPIRHVCVFGRDLVDGVVPFHDLFSVAEPDPVPALERPINPAAHVAAVTWDMSLEGLVPVARSHSEWLTAGAGIALESRLEADASILSTIAMSSFAGLSLSVVPWLMVGGTLLLHQPFAPEVLAEQVKGDRPAVVIVPAPVAWRLAGAGILQRREGVKTLIAAWRAPERLSASLGWTDPAIGFVDVQLFGEVAALARRRGDNGAPQPIALGPLLTPHGAAGAIPIAEISRTEVGTMAIGGPMVPKFAFPPNAEHSDQPWLKVDAKGFVDTGYKCRVDEETRTVVVTAPPSGLVSIGGYSFAQRELEALASDVGHGTTLACLPDGLGGQRLAGHTADRVGVQEELRRRGLNPLIVNAFQARRVEGRIALGAPGPV